MEMQENISFVYLVRKYINEIDKRVLKYHFSIATSTGVHDLGLIDTEDCLTVEIALDRNKSLNQCKKEAVNKCKDLMRLLRGAKDSSFPNENSVVAFISMKYFSRHDIELGLLTKVFTPIPGDPMSEELSELELKIQEILKKKYLNS